MKIDMKLELVPVPVTNIDRAKTFYIDKLRFAEDVDVQLTEAVRIVQLIPPRIGPLPVFRTDLRADGDHMASPYDSPGHRGPLIEATATVIG